MVHWADLLISGSYTIASQLRDKDLANPHVQSAMTKLYSLLAKAYDRLPESKKNGFDDAALARGYKMQELMYMANPKDRRERQDWLDFGLEELVDRNRR